MAIDPCVLGFDVYALTINTTVQRFVANTGVWGGDVLLQADSGNTGIVRIAIVPAAAGGALATAPGDITKSTAFFSLKAGEYIHPPRDIHVMDLYIDLSTFFAKGDTNGDAVRLVVSKRA